MFIHPVDLRACLIVTNSDAFLYFTEKASIGNTVSSFRHGASRAKQCAYYVQLAFHCQCRLYPPLNMYDGISKVPQPLHMWISIMSAV